MRPSQGSNRRRINASKCALASPRRPNEGDYLAGTRLQINTLEDGPARFVAKCNVLDANMAALATRRALAMVWRSACPTRLPASPSTQRSYCADAAAEA